MSIDEESLSSQPHARISLPPRITEVKFSPFGDDRGQLIAVEGNTVECPFEVKRTYYIFDTTPGTVRGKHAHRKLKQLLICVSGSCVIKCDDGAKTLEYKLDWPDHGLLIEGLVWREMLQFSKGAVLLVLASETYDEEDYIRSYTEFRSAAEMMADHR